LESLGFFIYGKQCAYFTAGVFSLNFPGGRCLAWKIKLPGHSGKGMQAGEEFSHWKGNDEDST
jgi:hypothetical protein